jgi:ribosomal peptide maturation radical SAM protein 1
VTAEIPAVEPDGRTGTAQVCLVSMPYAGITRPSMALGLLKAILARDGLRVMTANANLWFADKVGLDLYQLCSMNAPITFLMGEWTFAAAAFPGAPRRDEQYLRHLTAVAEEVPQILRNPGGPRALAGQMRELRAAATGFVDEAARRVLATGAKVVGCTSTFEQHVASLALLRRVHELDPDVITMMGGANCETEMGETTHRCFPWLDYVVSGEADGIIAGLCRLALARGRDVERKDLPPGVLGPPHRPGRESGDTAAGDGNRARHRLATMPRALFRDLDSLPVPAYDDYFTDLAASPNRAVIRPGLPAETSRGCWWGNVHQCTFCGLNGSSMGFRSKSPDRAIEEFHALEDRHGIRSFELVDNILDMGYFSTVLPALAADGQPRRLFYEIKANLSRKHVEALVTAGITWVQPGIESLHSGSLELMDKGVRAWQNIQLLKWARELGLRLSWSMLWGFPGERDEWYAEVARFIPLLEHLQAPGGLARLRYDRFSVYHQQAQQRGLILLPIPAMSYVYPVDRADLDGLAYFFTNDPGGDGPVLAAGAVGNPSRRPGVQAMREAAFRWRDAFNAPSRPILSVTDRDGALHVVDTRECAIAQRITLDGLDRAVYLATNLAPRAERITRTVTAEHGMTVSGDQVAASVRKLVAAGLVLPIDGRLLSLAIPGAIPELPGDADFPGGYVDMSKLPPRYPRSPDQDTREMSSAGAVPA